MSNIRLSAAMYRGSEAAIIASIMGAAAVQDRARKAAYVPPVRAPYDFTRREKQLWALYFDNGLSSEDARKAVIQYRRTGQS